MAYVDAGDQRGVGIFAVKSRTDSDWETWICNWSRAEWVEALAGFLGSFDMDESVFFTLVFKHSGRFMFQGEICTAVVVVEGG